MKKNLLFILFLFISIFAFGQTSEKEQAARNWIKANYKDFKFNSDNDLKLRFVRKGLSGETLRFQQMMNGVPVFDSEIVINFSPSGEVALTDFNVNKTLTAISTTPQITKEGAIAISDKELQVSGLVNSQETKLFIYNKLGTTKLVYRIFTSFEKKSGGWEVFVDAISGEV